MNLHRICVASATLLAACALAACDDPVSPCSAPHACEVTGVDLELVHIRVLDLMTQRADPVTGLRIVTPADTRIEFVVRNRGDRTSPPAAVRVHFDAEPVVRTVPPLAPGASFADTTSVTLRAFATAAADVPGDVLRRIDLRVASAVIEWADSTDAVPANDAASADTVHLALPILTGNILGVSADDITVGRPFTLTYALRNVSLHGGVLPPLDLTVCLWDFDLGCYFAWWTRSGSFRTPALAASSTYHGTIDTALLPTAAWQDDALDYSMALCVLDRDDPYIDLRTTGCIGRANRATTRVRPDYETCTPPVLTPGLPVTLSQFNCGLRPATTRPLSAGAPNPPTSWRFMIWALDAQAGVSYRIERSASTTFGGLSFRDARGEPAVDIDPAADRVAFAATGRYYALAYSQPPVTVTATPLSP